MSGQWWRLVTSMFLHFGVMHLAFNMLALWVFGVLAERLFGNVRFLAIYLIAGIAGSVTSFLWHPVVNGAGASGAIFGVLGALLAFFLRGEEGVPKSVLRAQRNSAALYIAYSLLNGARMGIDNAAHLGGLLAGMLLGYLLSRPLSQSRAEQSWTAQWLRTGTIVGAAALLVGTSLTSGRLHPRLLRDSDGNGVPTAALVPQRTYDGVTLGMTPDQVLKAKGAPVKEEDARHWVYYSIDADHDGVLNVLFRISPSDQSRSVEEVLFFGKKTAEPPGLPDLMGLTREELVRQYGEPVRSFGRKFDYEYLGFRNGVIALIQSGKTTNYGIYAPRPDR
jgi:hypothetical protein